MGKPTGFKEFPRETVPYRDPVERASDFLEIFLTRSPISLIVQPRACSIGPDPKKLQRR